MFVLLAWHKMVAFYYSHSEIVMVYIVVRVVGVVVGGVGGGSGGVGGK